MRTDQILHRNSMQDSFLTQVQSQKLIDNFYTWERKFRGHIVNDCPIIQYPAFEPFNHVTNKFVSLDDARRPSTLQIISKFASQLFPPPEKRIIPENKSIVKNFSSKKNVTYKIVSSEIKKNSLDLFEQLLGMLTQSIYPLAFEIIADDKSIIVQLTVSECESDQIYNQIKAHFPDIILKKIDDIFQELEATKVSMLDLALKEEFVIPLSMTNGIEPEPFVGLFAVLDQLKANEILAIQILFKGSINYPWAKNILKSITNFNGNPLFVNAPEMSAAVKQKILFPLVGANIRVVAQSKTFDRSKALTKSIANILVHISHSPSNNLTILDNDNYPIEHHFEDILLRQSRRNPMVLNIRELMQFVHLPFNINSDKYHTHTRKTKVAPSITEGHELVLGINEHNGISKQVSISNDLRFRHMVITGATGTGKSYLIRNMALSDAEHGKGFCIIEPHGDLIDGILNYLPEHRMKDVILFDLSDSEYPIAFNILKAHTEIEQEVLSSDLIAAFRKQSTSWGDGLNTIFANGLATIIQSRNGGTLSDLRKFLLDKNFRKQFLKSVRDTSLVFFWEKEFPMLRSSSVGSIMTRLDFFLRPKVIRNIICQKECLDFADILNTKKILLVKLPHGLVGIENSHLLGTTIVSKVFQAALLRQGQQQRSDFYFYIDEFQNYLTESIANILAEGRKFNLSLVLAHQSLSQITNDQIAESIFANAAIRVCFRLGQKDATKLAESFSTFTASDFQNLATGEAIVKVGQSNFDFSLKTCSLKNVKNNEKSIKELVETSRAKYCKSKSLVEEDLSQSLNNIPVNSKEDVEIISSPLISNEHGIKKQSASILPTNTKLNSHNVPLKSNIDSDHRFLQNRIKQVASVYGYKSTIEAATSDGKGRVDVLLEKDDITIAVEISIATDITWEIHNIKKCLENSYSKIISCHTDTKSILAMKNRIKETFKTEELAKIQVLSPENVYQYLGTTLKENGQPKTIKGYEVNVEYNNNEGGKRQSIAKILLATSKEKK